MVWEVVYHDELVNYLWHGDIGHVNMSNGIVDDCKFINIWFICNILLISLNEIYKKKSLYFGSIDKKVILGYFFTI